MDDMNLDNLPLNVQKAIYSVFSNSATKDKLVFLSRLKYGNDLSYKELSEMMGVSFQRIQQMYDGMIGKISKSPYIAMSGVICSGLIICDL